MFIIKRRKILLYIRFIQMMIFILGSIYFVFTCDWAKAVLFFLGFWITVIFFKSNLPDKAAAVNNESRRDKNN